MYTKSQGVTQILVPSTYKSILSDPQMIFLLIHMSEFKGGEEIS